MVASQARLPGSWTVAQMMASYNQFHASDDPIVRAAMDQIARQAFYGVTQGKYQQKVQVALYEQAVESARRQHAVAVLDRATKEAEYYRAAAGLPADPLAPPVVFEDKGFFGNRLEAAKGFIGEGWNTATSMAKSGFDTSAFSYVFRHDQFEEAAAQQHDAFWGSIEENGWVAGLTMQFNPVYHGIDAYVGAQEAFDRGDYRAVGENSFNFTVATVSTAAIAIPGAQLAVGLAKGVFAKLAVASQAEANIVRVETAIANAMERTAAAEANAATATAWVEGSTAARATLTAEAAAANSATSLVGRQYGVGTVVENPGLTIEGFAGASDPAHALNQVINRGLSPTVLRDTVANPRVVLQQGNGNFLYLSDDAAIVLRSDGQMVTAYGSADYRAHILSILADAAG